MPLQNTQGFFLATRHLCLVLQRIRRGGLCCRRTDPGARVLDEQVTALNPVNTTLSACTLTSTSRTLTFGDVPLATGAGQAVLLRVLPLLIQQNTCSTGSWARVSTCSCGTARRVSTTMSRLLDSGLTRKGAGVESHEANGTTGSKFCRSMAFDSLAVYFCAARGLEAAVSVESRHCI
jgi:hypothetical protein